MVEYALPEPQPPGASCAGCGRSSVGAIAAGADGNLWFADGGRRKVGRITPSGQITEFDLPDAGGSPYGITAGPDKNMWVTITNAGPGRTDWIARVSPTGMVTRFQAGTSPEGISAGPDGNIWFTEAGAGRIGRMTVSGDLVEYPLANPQSNPNSITAGTDGNVWFVETGHYPAIAKITPSGKITEYPVGALDEFAVGTITAGPDGNLWFTKWRSSGSPLEGSIGRITPSGVMTTFPLPRGSRATGIASGPDGSIWFTDTGLTAVGRMSIDGALRQFPLPRRGAQPWAITSGPDGRMWFAEGSWIASIGITVPEAKVSSRVLRFSAGAVSNMLDVTSTGESNLKISTVAITGADRGEFAISKDGCSGRAVAVNESCRIEVSFAVGAGATVRAAVLTIADNATGSPHAVSLVGQLPDCKLPVFVSATPTSYGEFLSLRDGVVTPDPAGRFVSNGMQSQSQASPVLRGYMPATYDRAAGRWVPGSAISPDGLRYAYVAYSQPFEGVLHVVDVATGRDRTLPLEKGPWGLIAFATDGIYMHAVYEGTGPGARIVDPDSGSTRTTLGDVTVQAVSGQVAWTATFNKADTLPGPPGIGGGNNELQAIDLKTSQKTSWLYRPGSNLYVLAATSRSALVQVYTVAGDSLLAVTAPGQAAPIAVPGTEDAISLSGGAAVAYGDAWWLGSLDGLYLWTSRTGAILVSESTASPAGACA